MTKIAFIGLGSMGGPMARNLLKRSFEVQGFDIAAKSLADLQGAGGTPAASAAGACAGANFVLLMVVDAAQAQTVLDGALAAAPSDATVCLMATCPPKSVESIAARVRRRYRSPL
ncbi:NAD(P)-binding domain-containing protein [Mesorhizobium sp. IMUNJ 23033]|uniref:NAD(P)-binding domain-containing protein n=1 Tax=Mesorhizobium sp. IMUNJ 23033 TaxID=3378039 RepID=UPI0038508592